MGGETKAGPQTYDRHIECLKQLVSKKRLYFFDLKDGWEPLCRILGKDITDVPFLHLNESAALDMRLQETVWLGVMRWAILVACLAFGVSLFFEAV